MLRTALLLVLLIALAALGSASELKYKDQLTKQLIEKVPEILKTYDSKTGHFGEGIWICRDQEAMFPLAAAYSLRSDTNKYYKDPNLLEIIMKAGDALIADMDGTGQWVFRKKDGSTWGSIWMPWTYSRWVRTYQLIKADMPTDRRDAWIKALTLGYSGIRDKELDHIENITSHHAMGLYFAGQALDRPEWCRDAADFLVKVVDKQSEGGYWSENVGPVVMYDFVYVELLGTYYGASKDQRILPALEKAAVFHRQFTYPGGQNVETIDERNPYGGGIAAGNVGFTFSDIGRAYLQRQWALQDVQKLSPDMMASLLLYGEEGPTASAPGAKEDGVFVLKENAVAKAATIRKGPWFVCLSAYIAPIPKSRWIMDRQNLVSIYHEKLGLILGGGNTKLQPAWSNFTVGDMSLLRHIPGDTNPDFFPKGELYHVPTSATLVMSPVPSLELKYGKEACRISVNLKTDQSLEYIVESTVTSGLPVAAHLTLLPHLEKSLVTGSGEKLAVGESPINLTAKQLKGSLTYSGYLLRLPDTATLHWPALPHDQYRKDGHAEAKQGRIEICIPLDQQHQRQILTLEIPERSQQK